MTNQPPNTVSPPTTTVPQDNPLQKAAEQLSQMTPESYLELLNYIDSMKDNLPEARASVNFFGTTSKGWDCQFTLRDHDEKILIKRFADFQEYLDRYHVSPKGKSSSASSVPSSPSAPPSSTPSPPPKVETRIPGEYPPDDGQAGIDTYEVEIVNHQVASNGAHFLLCKGGKYMKYGYRAYEEIVPDTVNFENWPMGQDFSPPDEVKVAWVDLEKKKIIRFGAR
jgi:hypothetical protein